MNTHNTFKLAAVTLLASTSLLTSYSASAASLNDVFSKVQEARSFAKEAKNSANTIKTQISGTVTSKLNGIQTKLDDLPKPDEILGNSKAFIEDNVSQINGELQRISGDFQAFKGNGCDSYSECGQLKSQILDIYSGLSSIQTKIPGYDVLPAPGELFVDPNVTAIENLPPMVLFGISTVTGPLNGLEDLQQISEWVEGLRFYAINGVEEDVYYKLPEDECQTLEDSIVSDNQVFADMSDVVGKIEIVTHIMKEVMPKDIVINAWFGTSLPNPALPVAVVMNKVSTDFNGLVKEEVEARRTQVKACRTQAFRNKMLASAGY